MKKIRIIAISFFMVGLASGQEADIILSSYSGQSSITALNSITLRPGFHIPSGSNVVLSIQGYPNVGSAPSAGQNYIQTRTFRVPVKENQLGQVRDISRENQTVQYFDGLGRPIQVVELKASPGYRDIVRHMEYDGYGRETHEYLPYAEQTGNNGSFKAGARASQAAYYGASGSWDSHVRKTPNPYAVTVFEDSPLNRVLQQGAPGAVWQPASGRTATAGRTVVMDYGTNVASGADAVKLWNINANGNGAASTSSYAAGRLYRVVTKDENWTSGKTGTVEEFTDMEGQVVLRRAWETESRKLETYYVYDDFGDLRYVIPPAVTAGSFTETAAAFTDYIYGYKYDSRHRVVEKKVPGKGWEYMVYNKNDQVVLTQDANQRGMTTRQWLYTKYDAFGRVVETGILMSNATRASLQTALDSEANTALWETRTGADYTNVSYPRSSKSVRMVNYYDDYTFNGASTATLQPSGITRSQKVKSLLTGARVFRTDGTAPLLTIHYYDDRGRAVQTASQNQLGGTDYVTNTFSFAGELLASKRDHRASAGGAVTTILTTNKYDHVGRLVETRKKVNSQPEIVQGKLYYNEVGQLRHKDLHVSGNTAVQEIVYAYNERGWLTGINNPASVTDKRRFGMQLNYANRVRAYNGNIGSAVWNTKVHGSQPQTPVQTYTYDYDPLNRLKKAAYSATGKVNFFNEELAYDNLGNIDTLRRTRGSTGWANHFKYHYTGSRLGSVSDAGTAAMGSSYGYDANGNVTSNSRLGITNIEYNYLNLPGRYTKGSQALQYTYDALGRKLTKQLGSSVVQYVDGIQYRDGAIEFIQTEEGRIVPAGSSFIYEYFLKDHLGNVRAVVDHTGTVKQIQDYYAFGLEMNPGNAYSASPINLYRYNGKEKQVELGLEQLDYGARFYDPVIGRWGSVDPLAEKYSSLSAYNYAVNNPLNVVDPDGRDVRSINGGVRYTGRDAQELFGLLQAMHGGENAGEGNDDPPKKKENGTSSLQAKIYQGGEQVAKPSEGAWNTVTDYIFGREVVDEYGNTVKVDHRGRVIPELITGTADVNGPIKYFRLLQAAKGGTKLLNQFNSAESLIKAAQPTFGKALKHGELQGFVKGNADAIFKSITNGGTVLPSGAVQMSNGTIINMYNATSTGARTLFINTPSQIYKIRITP
ncbi:RHS repeat-associated core domain-containing protein [Parapedobacter sp. ISTM3]|uniref:DUF6443 domain-containing protein n=1 Tax=Parapedobacter sp. ISTM3 TaxID=2800130 RepID=UPI00190861CB|nr:DUF6443 domain-containing protein [Parapedobacter sp. ISTM3]MBK1442511.1 RHS repeat-associated core domain-containing protein [Parapedobacter sp. ISTM3]